MRTRWNFPSAPWRSSSTATATDGRTRPESLRLLPAVTCLGVLCVVSAGVTRTGIALDVTPAAVARTSPPRRHATRTTHEPSMSAVVRATVTHAPLLPRFCSATTSPAPAVESGRMIVPLKTASAP